MHNICSLFVVICLSVVGFGHSARADVEIRGCDRLAANPLDPDRVTDGVPRDKCRVEALWKAAATQNHSNAQVSYVDFALMGRFDMCDEHASTAEMRTFLDGAELQLGYVGSLLIANLRRDLEELGQED